MSVNCSFIPLPVVTQVGISDHDIGIWHGKIADLSGCYYPLYSLLNKAELAAASRFHQDIDKKSYVIRHGVLRLLLGRQLTIPATDIVFKFNTNNKPYLDAVGNTYCFFNISHSADEFLIAIGKDALGVDMEKIDPAFDWQDIADTYFGAAEVKFIANAPDPTQTFFLLWTRKEALIKACGMGIDDNLPLVPALDGLHQLPGHYPEKNWLTQSFTVSHNFIGSITYPSPQRRLALIQIDATTVQAML